MVRHFHALLLGWAFSSFVMSCIFMPRDFDGPSFSHRAFSVDHARRYVARPLCFTAVLFSVFNLGPAGAKVHRRFGYRVNLKIHSDISIARAFPKFYGGGVKNC